MSTLIVCTGSDTECINCGGSADERYQPGRVERTDYGGPWCSIDCHDEWVDWTTREAEERARQQALCPDCGFDNDQHNVACTLLPDTARRRQLEVMFDWMGGR